MARLVALYLPQFHPVKENDEWWGKGFTEWVNVAKARPMFRGHKQPHIPADLGFYDLRLSETREQQAELAREAGVEGFCYWHYWFGHGKRLLERPFNEVVESGKPDFPFCLAWANCSWYKKQWNKDSGGKDIVLIKQEYPGVDDYIEHFKALLPAFKDKRYMKVNGKLIFVVYAPTELPDAKLFMDTWRRLAAENGLEGFYFIGQDTHGRHKNAILSSGFDAVFNNDLMNIHNNQSSFQKIYRKLLRDVFNRPTIYKYKDAIKYMITEDCRNTNVFPSIAPNWDHSPRSGGQARILIGSTPELYYKLAKRAIDVVKDKPEEEQLIFIKSWNEWGEGNYMEPDLEFGKGYIEALRKAVDKK